MSCKYIFCLSFMVFISCNRAQEIDTPNLDWSIAIADMVVIGQTVSRTYHDQEGSTTPYFLTTYQIEPEVILKGDTEIENIEVLTRDGRLSNGNYVSSSHIPSPYLGQRAVFFLGQIDFDVLRRNADFGLIDMASVNATEGSDHEFNAFSILAISDNRVSTRDGAISVAQLRSKFDK